MNITLCSAFRNSESYLDRYLRQASSLDVALARRMDSLNFILGEGDSTDSTADRLEYFLRGADGIAPDCSHGGSEFGSVEHPGRFKQLAYVANRIWMCIPDNSDVVLWVESDLIWDADTMVKLIDHTATYPAISPMVYLQRDEWPLDAFYDVFAFREGGRRFTHGKPYHACYDPVNPFRVDSAGSAMAIRGDIARRILWDEQVFVGACAQIYKLGGAVYVDPKLSVIHR
jgi:hypothetical protein